jgi:hypothetical protein
VVFGGSVLRGLLWCLVEAGGSEAVGVVSVKRGHGGGGEVVLPIWCGMVGSRARVVWPEVM